VRDAHGNGHTVVTQQCDGPSCERTIRSNDPEFGNWGSLLGFVDVGPLMEQNLPDANWCSPRCLFAWAAVAVVDWTRAGQP
jgi:hypothetical protein